MKTLLIIFGTAIAFTTHAESNSCASFTNTINVTYRPIARCQQIISQKQNTPLHVIFADFCLVQSTRTKTKEKSIELAGPMTGIMSGNSKLFTGIYLNDDDAEKRNDGIISLIGFGPQYKSLGRYDTETGILSVEKQTSVGPEYQISLQCRNVR